MSLYETLDLNKTPPPNAAEIKRAYKKKAKETHPDKAGGSSEAFAKVSRAYLVLSDPVRRKRYDETGDIPENPPENAALNLLVQFFVGTVQLHANGQGPDPCAVDLIDVARKECRKAILDAENHQVKLRRTIKLWQKVAGKLKTKKKADLVTRALHAQIIPLEQQIRLMDDQIVLRKDVLKLLDGYTFDFDAPASSGPA